MTEPSPKQQADFPLDDEMKHEPKKKPEKATVMVKKNSVLPWLILGLGLGSIATLGVLPYLPLSVANQLNLPVVTVIEPVVPPPPVTPPIVKEQKNMTKSPVLDKQTWHELQSSMENLQQRLNSFPPLKEGMQTLSNDLQALHQDQSRVRAAQINIETMQLHSRLSWITNPSSHLPQMQLAWEEIVLLPSLNETQHEQAKAMLALAATRQKDVYHWQQALGRVIASYHYQPISSHNILTDWLPSEGRFAPISAWLIQQLHLQKVQQKDHAVIKLRQQLHTIQQNMSLEQWPDAKPWMALRSRLQLHMLHDDASHQALALPEDFSPIQSDIQQLQQTAHDWLKRSSQ